MQIVRKLRNTLKNWNPVHLHFIITARVTSSSHCGFLVSEGLTGNHSEQPGHMLSWKCLYMAVLSELFPKCAGKYSQAQWLRLFLLLLCLPDLPSLPTLLPLVPSPFSLNQMTWLSARCVRGCLLVAFRQRYYIIHTYIWHRDKKT